MIEVHIAGGGRVRGDEPTSDPGQGAHCSLCDRDVDKPRCCRGGSGRAQCMNGGGRHVEIGVFGQRQNQRKAIPAESFCGVSQNGCFCCVLACYPSARKV